eukprot:TRINITY_DN22294_c0_g1_i1.p2 TRINITY_DN22294_c0_g1~~TRINITY_DN22294_c0_g1_i1.p2  ORF type:complete len:111 (+),score=0.17 TRINITY_DN22294_c0_g1_i1:294-626(+)
MRQGAGMVCRRRARRLSPHAALSRSPRRGPGALRARGFAPPVDPAPLLSSAALGARPAPTARGAGAGGRRPAPAAAPPAARLRSRRGLQRPQPTHAQCLVHPSPTPPRQG